MTPLEKPPVQDFGGSKRSQEDARGAGNDASSVSEDRTSTRPAGGTPALPVAGSSVDKGLRRRLAQRAESQRGRSRPSPWRSRGYLPHFDQVGLIQSITFRLVDSLPRGFLEKCEKDLAGFPENERKKKRYIRIERMLDRGIGECRLRDPRVAEMVENALLHFDTKRYRLLCWCIMPNHVHSMIEIFPGHPLKEVAHTWKSFTSHEANGILKRSGNFWQREYHDRFIRDDDHYANTVRYIGENPVKAGLVSRAEDWRWSSRWRGR